MAYAQFTAGDLKTSLNFRLGFNTSYWTAAERLRSQNEALCAWQAMTGDFTIASTISVVNSQVYYAVPTLVASVSRVTFLGVPLQKTSIEELDLGIPDWQNASTSTPTMWAPVGISLIAIYPPTTTVVGTTLDIVGIAEAPVLVNDVDTVNLPSADTELLLSYGHHFLEFKEGGAEFSSTQEGFKEFVGGASLRNSQIIATSTFKRLMGVDAGETLRKARSPVKTLGPRS